MSKLISGLLLLILSAPGFSKNKKDTLSIISPHRKSIQEEFIPVFREYYKKTYGTEVEVDWLDQGGTSNAVRYVRTKFSSNPATTGVDVFWGGTSANFVDMADEGFLAPYELSKEIRATFPVEASGVRLSDKNHLWHATCISSFGVVYNKRLTQMLKMKEPATWEDLGTKEYFQNVTLADPRKSGTNSTMHMIVMESMGWDKGWRTLMRIAGNTRLYTHSSSDPVKAVVSGDTVASMVIDFYGLAKIWDLGKENLGFILPKGQTILDPDPIAILKGAPQRKVAERFVNFLLSEDAQKLWLLPKGTVDGPRLSNLARMSVLPALYPKTKSLRLYSMNPFTQPKFLSFDPGRAGKLRRPLNDLFGAVFVDSHRHLKAAWKKLIDKGLPEKEVENFLKPIVTEQEIMKYAESWDDNLIRNKAINEWIDRAKKRFAKVSENRTDI